MKRMLVANAVSGRDWRYLPEVPQAARCSRHQPRAVPASGELSTRETSPGAWDAATSFLIGLQLDCVAMLGSRRPASWRWRRLVRLKRAHPSSLARNQRRPAARKGGFDSIPSNVARLLQSAPFFCGVAFATQRKRVISAVFLNRTTRKKSGTRPSQTQPAQVVGGQPARR